MIRFIGGVALSVLILGTALAQQFPPLLQLASSGFDESYSAVVRDLPRDPMRTLVGLHYGRARGPFHIDQVGVALAPDAPPANYCVRLLSEDTRYRAVNPYRKSPDKKASPFVETRSQYASDLARDFASDAI